MRIDNFSFTRHTDLTNGIYGYNFCNEATLSISDCSDRDLSNIAEAVRKRYNISIINYMPLKNPSISYTVEDCLSTTYFPKRSDFMDDLKVIKVIYHNPATIVFWSDGTKTVVKCGKDDIYDKERGFYIACAKKLFGNDYKAVGRINKALEMAEDKNDI